MAPSDRRETFPRLPLRVLLIGVLAATAVAGPIAGLLLGHGLEAALAELGPGMLAAVGGAWVLCRLVAGPLDRLGEVIREGQAGDLERRAGGAFVRELDELAVQLNRALAALQSSTDSLIYRAFHDSLTELPNRAMFLAAFARALGAQRRPGQVAVMFLDVDRFKFLNDTLGHAVGDQLLSVFAQRLVGAAGGQMVARLGGDEFTVLVQAGDAGRAAREIAGRILAALERPFSIAGQELFVSTSIGIAVSSEGDRSTTDLLRKADVALYRAKGEGRARWVVFSPELDADAAERFDLDNALRRAVERNELLLLYQPLVDLRTGTLLGMEALLRWNHPHRGVLSPATFISIAEESGEIVRIGQWVAEEACRKAAAFQRLRPGKPLTVCVNISAAEFRQRDLPARLRQVLEHSGLAPEQLKLELTESVLLEDAPAAVEMLGELKQLGVRLALDDFGTGYSSLSYLQRLPIDTLKVDQSFVERLGVDATSGPLVRAMVEMGEALGMEVVAEGVETEWQAACLREVGCTAAQGRFFAGPLTEEQFARLVASNRPVSGWE
ncbi:putative bifunctional diguanylate cyclase/phosphodiesterase, partial [Tepidiforma sp.]|uniref:putative bifunctional diguanylate cyclase/phosphodiesterase n=1 Tax=Tepidiforma sp. TaxID=2682230 RepID=UPI002ADE59E7